VLGEVSTVFSLLQKTGGPRPEKQHTIILTTKKKKWKCPPKGWRYGVTKTKALGK